MHGKFVVSCILISNGRIKFCALFCKVAYKISLYHKGQRRTTVLSLYYSYKRNWNCFYPLMELWVTCCFESLCYLNQFSLTFCCFNLASKCGLTICTSFIDVYVRAHVCTCTCVCMHVWIHACICFFGQAQYIVSSEYRCQFNWNSVLVNSSVYNKNAFWLLVFHWFTSENQ